MNNLVILCAVLLASVCHLGKAYDFQDGDFNVILSSDLQEALDSFESVALHPRVRRDEEGAPGSEDKCKKRHRKPKLCCADESIESLLDQERQLFKTCFKEIMGVEKASKHEHGAHRRFDMFSCEEVEKRKTDMICVQQCIGQKKGLLNEDGSPNEEGLISQLKQSFSKVPWVDAAAEKIVAACLAEAKNATENAVKFYTEGLKSCNPSGLTLKHCIFKEIQYNCPADQIKDRSSCDKFRDLTKMDTDIYPPRPDGPRDD